MKDLATRDISTVNSGFSRGVIQVHIERLILEGIPLEPAQRPLLQAAVEAELARLLAEGGLAAGFLSGGAVPAVRAGAIELGSTQGPVQLGQQIARAVYGGIGQPEIGMVNGGER